MRWSDKAIKTAAFTTASLYRDEPNADTEKRVKAILDTAVRVDGPVYRIDTKRWTWLVEEAESLVRLGVLVEVGEGTE